MDTEYTPFDLHRMFIGDEFSLLFIAEILVRTAIMYLSALLLVRFIGKRGLGQLSPFEYLVVITMGSATGDPMFYPEVPLLHGAVVLTMIVALKKLFLKLSQKSGIISTFVESPPTLLIDHGVLLEDHLKSEAMSKDDLFVKLREAGIEDLGEIRYAFIEPSGQVSIFRLPADRQFAVLSILPVN